MKLAEKLVYLRKKQGLSQLKLAEMMNVSRQAISRWETGIAVPSAENLKYLGNLYNVSLDYLFNDDVDELEENEKATEEIEDEIKLMLQEAIFQKFMIMDRKIFLVMQMYLSAFNSPRQFLYPSPLAQR